MAFPKAAPRVKGPYFERGCTRFRIRICAGTGHRDLYFASLEQAQSAKIEAERELPQNPQRRSLQMLLDEYSTEKVHRGLCTLDSAEQHRALVVLSTYAIGCSPLTLENLLGELGMGELEAGELGLAGPDGARVLPAGFCARWSRGLRAGTPT